MTNTIFQFVHNYIYVPSILKQRLEDNQMLVCNTSTWHCMQTVCQEVSSVLIGSLLNCDEWDLTVYSFWVHLFFRQIHLFSTYWHLSFKDSFTEMTICICVLQHAIFKITAFLLFHYVNAWQRIDKSLFLNLNYFPWSQIHSSLIPGDKSTWKVFYGTWYWYFMVPDIGMWLNIFIKEMIISWILVKNNSLHVFFKDFFLWRNKLSFA